MDARLDREVRVGLHDQRQVLLRVRREFCQDHVGTAFDGHGQGFARHLFPAQPYIGRFAVPDKIAIIGEIRLIAGLRLAIGHEHERRHGVGHRGRGQRHGAGGAVRQRRLEGIRRLQRVLVLGDVRRAAQPVADAGPDHRQLRGGSVAEQRRDLRGQAQFFQRRAIGCRQSIRPWFKTDDGLFRLYCCFRRSCGRSLRGSFGRSMEGCLGRCFRRGLSRLLGGCVGRGLSRRLERGLSCRLERGVGHGLSRRLERGLGRGLSRRFGGCLGRGLSCCMGCGLRSHLRRCCSCCFQGCLRRRIRDGLVDCF